MGKDSPRSTLSSLKIKKIKSVSLVCFVGGNNSVVFVDDNLICVIDF